MSNTINVIDEPKYIAPPRTQKTEAEIMASWDNVNEIVVSISCLTFNHAEFIEDAINGFLIQETNFAFEVLIHDDASTDNTAEIIRKYAEKYPNIIFPIYQQENTYSKGFGTFLFNALRVKGKYTALCEGDDFWFDKDKLQLQVNFLDKNSDVVMCGHDVSQIAPDTKILLESELRLTKNEMYSQNRIALGFNLPSKSAMWRSDLPCLGPKMPFSDTFLFGYYGNFGKAYNLKRVMAAYRIHEGGMWSGSTEAQRVIDSYYVYESLAKYALPKFKAIAYLGLLIFSLNNKESLNLSNSDIKDLRGTILKYLNINSFPYVYAFTINRVRKAAKRKIRGIFKKDSSNK